MTAEQLTEFKKKLNDPASKPGEYRVKDCGYCPKCNKVTPYSPGFFGAVNQITCDGCGTLFARGNAGVHQPYDEYLRGEAIPTQYAADAAQLWSRESQRKFFTDALADAVSTAIISRQVQREVLAKMDDDLRRLTGLI